MAEISDKIFRLLKQKGMSQKELSQRTGIRESTISDWKNKQVNPSSDRILPICNALGVNPYELLGSDGALVDFIEISEENDEYRLIEAFRSMPDDLKKRVLGYMDALIDIE